MGNLFFDRFSWPKSGVCRLCSQKAHLSWDHVPPRICSNIGRYDVYDLLSVDPRQRILTTRNGLKFRSICRKCNSDLSLYDKHLGDISSGVRTKIRSEAIGVLLPKPFTMVWNPGAIVRGLAGLFLSVYSIAGEITGQPLHEQHPYPAWLHDLYNGGTTKPVFLYCWIHNFQTINLFPYIAYVPDVRTSGWETMSDIGFS